MGQRYYDFSEYSDGPLGNSPHWVQHHMAQAGWTAKVYTDGTATGGKVVKLESNSSGAGWFAFRCDEIGSTTGDIEIVVRAKSLSGIDSGPPFAVGLLSAADSDDAYAPMPYGAAWYGQYYNDSSEAANLGGPVSSPAPAADTYFWLRFGRSSTTIQWKVWTGTAGDEPGSWGGTATHGTITEVYAGLLTKARDVVIDVFGVGTAGSSAPTSAPAAGVNITNAGDEVFETGEAITITGTGFGASQGAGKVYISPADDVNDSGRVEQTVTAWGDTSISITVVRTGLAFLTDHKLFVVNNGGSSNASGYTVQIEPKVYVRHTLIDPDTGSAQASLTDLTMHIWRGAITGAPDQTIGSVTTDGSGVLSQKINRGSLAVNDRAWCAIAKTGSPGSGGILHLTPSYE